MKRSVITLVAGLGALEALGQGTVRLDNDYLPTTCIKAPFYAPEPGNLGLAKTGNTSAGYPLGTQTYSGAPLGGSAYVAQLFYAAGKDQPESALMPASPTTTFHTGIYAGFVVAVTSTLSGVPSGSLATCQVRAWDNSDGTRAQWSDAQAAWEAGLIPAGKSVVFNLTAGSGNGTNLCWLPLSFNLYYLPPVITAQPLSQTVPAGTNATFTVSATGLAPLGYQWRFSGTNLSGATGSAYTITNVQPASAGPYAVVITNLVGSVTSAVATLSLALPPVAVSLPVTRNLVDNVTLNGTVNPFGTPAVAWFEWGKTASYGQATVPGAVGTGTPPVAVSNILSQLELGTRYHFCLVASNSAGVSRGADMSFVSGLGFALSLDGSGQYVSLPSTPSDWLYSDFTIEGWVYVRSYGNNARLVEFGNGPGKDTVALSLSSAFTGCPELMVYGATQTNHVVAPTPLPLNQWVHLAATLQTGTFVTNCIYTNGQLAAAWVAPGGTPTPALRTNNFIGQSGWPFDASANASFREVRVWNLARSQSQIRASLNLVAEPPQPGLLGCWHFDESADVFAANAVDGLPAVLSGGTWVPRLEFTWASGVSGKYESLANWWLGGLPNSLISVCLTNSGAQTNSLALTIDAATTNFAPSSTIISNLAVSAAGTNQLALSVVNSALHVRNGLTVQSNGTVQIQGGAVVQVDGVAGVSLGGGFYLRDGGSLVLDGGALLCTNTNYVICKIGSHGDGQMTVSNGFWQADCLDLGSVAGAHGMLTLAGGTNIIGPTYGYIGSSPGATGEVWLTGGQLITTNSLVYIGEYGVGQVNVSGGSWQAKTIGVADRAGSQGTLSISGGQVDVGRLDVGLYTGNAPGTVLLSGGQLNSDIAYIGDGIGQMIVSNGVWQGRWVDVGNLANSQGSLTIAGGSSTIADSLMVAFANNATGSVYMTGGQLAVTNADPNLGRIWVGGEQGTYGQFIVSNGTLLANSIIVATNETARGLFCVLGGTVIIGGQAVTNGFRIGDSATASGSVQVTGGQLMITNTDTIIGNSGMGQMMVSNATVATRLTTLGAKANAAGSLTLLSGASLNVSSNLVMGSVAGATGTVTVASGTLSVTNGVVRVGPAGSGQMNILGGSTTVSQLLLGGTNGTGSGGLYLTTNGHLKVLSLLRVNACGIDGGDLDGSGGTIIVGEWHDASMTVSGGAVHNIGTLDIGYTPGFTGTFTQDGGYVSVVTNVVVGDSACTAVGNVTLSGGLFCAQNMDQTAIFDLRNGTVTLQPGGNLYVDTLILTNSCGHFVNNGGYVRWNQLVLPASAPPLVLRISYDSATSSATLSWPSIYVGYYLEQNPDLSPGNWSAVSQTPTDDGTTRSVTISPATDNMFYRLSKPL